MIKVGTLVQYVGSAYEDVSFGIVDAISEDVLMPYEVFFFDQNDVRFCEVEELQIAEGE